MNYRHAFHAGNFADVVKHAVLCRVLMHLRDKPAAFRVIDTHAGAGAYELAGAEASRTGEWRDGIGRLREAVLPAAAAELLKPYLDAVAACNGAGRLTVYPGSPALIRALLRRQDRAVCCELEPKAAAALARALRGDARAKAVAIDGWMALNAYLPPLERRGLVLIDPPFEAADDFTRMVAALAAAHRKWPTGIYLLWYPIKDAAAVTDLVRRVTRLGIAKTLQAEITVATETNVPRLRGSGLLVVNPPWKLPSELGILLPALATTLAAAAPGTTTLRWLADEISR
jgi:23S rRNA (adenine2030-N6)-methyltransferase